MSDSTCTIVPYGARHLDSVIGLLGGDGWRRTLWPWQYESRAAAGAVVAEDEARNVVGFNGCMPVSVKIEGLVTEAVWSCDFIVSPDWRKRGVGSAMKRHLQARHPLIMALGISDAGANVHGRVGWTSLPGVPQYSLQRRVRTTKDLAKRAAQVAARLAGAVLRLPRPDVQITVQPASLLPPDVDALWHRVESTYGNVVRRDEPYLRWRYVTHPLADYQLIVARGGDVLQAIGVFWRGEGRSTLVDYIGPAGDIGLKAAVVERFVRESGDADRLTCATSDSGFRRVLLRRGFRTWSNRPLRFHVCCAPHIPVAGGNSWFLMGGDSDGDLLAAARSGYVLRSKPISCG